MRKFLIALLYLSFFITNTFAQCSTFGVAKFSFSPANGCSVPKTIFFTDQSLLPDTWLWDFGDGSTSTAQNPIHTFTSVGDFTVKLTVVNTTYGCTSFITKVVSISAPNADFTATKTFGCGPLTTTFNDSSTGASQWDWDFGDGNTSTAQNPTHIYSSPGTYNVKLIITASNGCTSTKTRSNYIQVIGPDTKFSANTTSGNKPLTVNFSNETTASSPIVGWLWNFGDGNTSTSQNPTHTYTSAGNYTVSLK
ncbi:MAG TPA: PKD domain-containing protein, partial [Pelobium sp.]|nr:PKD domain-containing protein [Pelobium sp.]